MMHHRPPTPRALWYTASMCTLALTSTRAGCLSNLPAASSAGHSTRASSALPLTPGAGLQGSAAYGEHSMRGQGRDEHGGANLQATASQPLGTTSLELMALCVCKWIRSKIREDHDKKGTAQRQHLPGGLWSCKPQVREGTRHEAEARD